MTDPLGEEESLTGMLPNGAFADDAADPADWSTGQGDDVPTAGQEREDEPDPGPDEVEPGQG